IDVHQLDEMIKRGDAVHLLDVRQPWEHDLCALPHSQLVPLDVLRERAGEIQPPPGVLVVAYCHHGVRSLHAAAPRSQLWRRGAGGAALAGGIDAWSQTIASTVPRY